MENELPHVVIGKHQEIVAKIAAALERLMVENPDGGVLVLHPNFWYDETNTQPDIQVDIKITYIPLIEGNYHVDMSNNRIHFNDANESHVLMCPETITTYDAEEYSYKIRANVNVSDIVLVLNIGQCILKQLCPDIRCISAHEQYYVSETHVFHLTIQQKE